MAKIVPPGTKVQIRSDPQYEEN